MLLADDSYVYCKADTNEADKVLELLQVYEDASGQKINKEKYSIFFSGNVIQYNRVEVNHKLGMKEADEHSTYLGLPNILGRKKSVVLSYLKDRVQNRIQSWRPKKFSKPMKEILIKKVAQSLPVFAMNVFLLPIKITKEIEKMLANFWRSSTDSGSRTINWMAWDRMTKHKHSGGLGFRSFRDFNLAMFRKHYWRLITNPNSLSAQIYKVIYFKDTSFLEASLGSSPSFIWRSLLEAKNVILTGSSWRVGTGNDIDIIGQPWLGNKENAFVTTVSPSIINQKISSLMCAGTRNWDWEVIADIFNNRDQESIQATIIEEEFDSDMLQWDWDITGQYTVKSAYNLLQVQKGAWVVHDNDSSCKALWKIKATKKALSVLWRALTHCLPTKMQLIQKRVQVDSLCEICKSGVENTAHIFLHCPFAVSCWEVLQVSPVWDSTWEFSNWFEQCLLHESRENKVKMIMFCWSLWRYKNDVVWNKKISRPERVVAATLEYLSQWKIAQNRFYKTCHRDGNGGQRLYRWSCERENKTSALQPSMAQAVAIKEALSWIKEMKWDKTVVESDCLVAIQSIRSSVQMRSRFGRVIDDCRRIIKGLNNMELYFIKRSANRSAHELARLSHMYPDRIFDGSSIPFIVKDCIVLDSVGK
ncbi:hypothetical protein AgCh_005064 [Apium graveolens]